MDYENKYNEALRWMRDVYPTLTGADKEDAEHYFPELVESEDERIRKIIYKLMLGMRKEIFTSQDETVTKDKVLSYLEKQKEPKDPFDDEQFKRGYEAGKHDGYQEGYKDGMESRSFHYPVMPTTPSGFGCDGIHCTNPHYDCINCPRKDSSAGRITTIGAGSITLSANDDNPSGLKATNKSLDEINKETLAEQKEQKSSTEETELNSLAFLEQLGYTCIPPKEQKHDKCAGCNNVKGCVTCIGGDQWAHIEEQKPAEWSKEDTLLLQKIIQDLISLSYDCQVDFNDKLNWLKELPSRFNLSKGQELSKYDEELRKGLIQIINDSFEFGVFSINCKERDNYINFLESISSRFNPQPKQEWSEEDNGMLEELIADYKFLCEKFSKEEKDFFIKCSYAKDENEMLSWLNSLPSRSALSHWKPSEEQMDWLATAVRLSADKPSIHKVIASLYNDLKKL